MNETSLFSYKTYERGSRLQHTDEVLNKGINATGAPLPDGYLQDIVNYVFKDNGNTLVPRPGFQTTKYAKITSVDSNITSDLYYYLGHVAISGDDTAVLFLAERTERHEKELISIDISKKVGNVVLPNIECHSTSNFQTSSAPYSSMLELPEYTTNKVHGMYSRATNKQDLGAWAWNNHYYYIFGSSVGSYGRQTDGGLSVEFKKTQAKQLTPKQAVATGYNMLSDEPYTFINEMTAEGTHINFTGLLPYNAQNKLQLNPMVNENLVFEAFYTAPAKSNLKIVWEWRILTDTTWTKLKEEVVDVDPTTTKLTVNFSPPVPEILMRISAYDTAGKDNLAIATLTVGFKLNKESYGSIASDQLKKYNIANYKGMCFWKNRLVVWGVPEANNNTEDNLIFTSAVNDPTYFPYPNGVSVFDSKVLYATPFNDDLLVFTTKSIYRVILSETGETFQSIIQSNLVLTESDTMFIKVIKNMIFFKSGNYFYMVVPKRQSLTHELTIANISTPIVNILDNFKDFLNKLLFKVYPMAYTAITDRVTKEIDTIRHINVSTDTDDIRINYFVNNPLLGADPSNLPDMPQIERATQARFIEVCLIYNTITRAWSIQLIGVDNIVQPYELDSTGTTKYCTLAFCYVPGFNDTANKFYLYPPTVTFQIIELNKVDIADRLLLKDSVFGTQVHAYYRNPFLREYVPKNYQYLDTGNRDHVLNLKKRYRELQFFINNKTSSSLDFYTKFYIDNILRQSPYKYKVVKDTSIDIMTGKPKNIITVEQDLVFDKTVPGDTILADEADIDQHSWQLSCSSLDQHTVYKVRFPVSGKGYTPRFVLGSMNEKAYELLNLSWIYRSMYSR